LQQSTTRRRPFTLSHLRWIVLGADSLLLALSYGDRAALGLAAPYVLKEFHFNAALWGLIVAAFSFGYAPFCFVGGYFSDRFGPRNIMATAVAWWSAFTAATAAGFSFVSFLVIRLLFGFGEGPQGSVTAKLVGSWFPQREVGLAVGISNGAMPLGGAIATPLITWLIVAHGGDWRLAFLVLGALGVAFTLLWYVVARDSPETHPWMSARELQAINSGALARRPALLTDQTAPPVAFYLRQPIVWCTAIAFFGFSWVLFTFIGWFPLYMVQAQHIDLKSIAVSAMIPWIVGTAGVLVGGIVGDALAKRTGKPAAVRKWMIVVCLLGVGIAFAPSAMVRSANGAVALMSICLFLMYLTNAQYWALLADVIPTSRLGGVGGFVHFVANIAGFIAPAATGAFVNATHDWTMGFVVGGAVVVASALSMACFGKLDIPRHEAPVLETALAG